MKFTDVLVHVWVAGFHDPHVGGVVSILAAGDWQDAVFPALSLIVTVQRAPLVFTVQLPPASWMPLPPVSVELERVNVTLLFSQVVPSGDQSQQVGSVVSEPPPEDELLPPTANADQVEKRKTTEKAVAMLLKTLAVAFVSGVMFGLLEINASIVTLMETPVKPPEKAEERPISVKLEFHSRSVFHIIDGSVTKVSMPLAFPIPDVPCEAPAIRDLPRWGKKTQALVFYAVAKGFKRAMDAWVPSGSYAEFLEYCGKYGVHCLPDVKFVKAESYGQYEKSVGGNHLTTTKTLAESLDSEASGEIHCFLSSVLENAEEAYRFGWYPVVVGDRVSYKSYHDTIEF